MKKIFAIIILGIFVVVLVAPLVVNAQAMKLQECCKLKADISITKGIIAVTNPCIQDVDGNNHGIGDTNPCIKDDPCIFVKGCTLGGTAGARCDLANINGDIDLVDGVVDADSEMWGLVCLVSSTVNITNWIFYLMMVGVVLMIVIGGATYMMAAGNPERAGKGKKIIIYGIIGLIIALVARLIPAVVKMIIGMV